MEHIYYTCRDPNKTSYPRYHNLNKRLTDLQQRVADLQAKLYDGAVVTERFGDARFIILSQRSTKRITTVDNSIEEALFPKGNIGMKFIVSLQEALKKIKSEATVVVFIPSGIIADCMHVNIIKNRDIEFVIVVNDAKEHDQITDLYEGFTNVNVSLFEDIKDTATVALETLIFRPMKNKTENLVRLLKSYGRQHSNAATNRKCKVRMTNGGTKMCRICMKRKRLLRKPRQETSKRNTKRREANKTKIKIGDTAQRVKKHRKRMKETSVCRECVQCEFQRSRTVTTKKYVTRKVFAERVHDHRDSIERLLGEISGLYNRSKVPEKDRPRINESLEQNVSDEVAAALYAIDPSVKSCGYRYSTLQVFVEDTSNNKINDRVREVVRKNNITNCDIVSSIGSFKPLFKVGAKVHPNQLSDSYGTVGGFAKKNKTDLCALMSRHVAIHSTDKNVFLSNGEKKIQASIIPETLPEQGPNDTILDISAAEIRQTDKEKCDTRFKTEDGDLTAGKESDYDSKILRNMQVHHWGASTSPGLGIITMPEIRDRDKDNTFMIIEDRQNSTDTLCKPGDSGSVVCADDIDGEGVEVISMLIGEDIDHVGRYATFRIDKGLEQLKQQTNDAFHLCKD